MICKLLNSFFLILFFLPNAILITANLYPPNGTVKVYDNQTIKGLKEQPYAIVVNFFANWCGHCKNFAPIYTTYAENLIKWENVLQIAALDCALYNDICIQYEIISFPTLKFFPPANNGTYYFDMQLEHNYTGLLNETLLQFFKPFNHPLHWPSYEFLNKNDVLSKLSRNNLYVIEKVNVAITIGLELILNYMNDPILKVYRVLSNETEIVFGDETLVMLTKSIIEKPFLSLTHHNISNNTYSICVAIVQQYGLNVDVEQYRTKISDREKAYEMSKMVESYAHSEIHNVIFSKYLRHIYIEDFESSLYHFFYNELLRYSALNFTQLTVLNAFVDDLVMYLPSKITQPKKNTSEITQIGNFLIQFANWLNMTTQNMLKTLIGQEQTIPRETIKAQLKPLESYFIHRNHWVGCKGSAPLLRGYPCGLWTLFHTLTIGLHLIDLNGPKGDAQRYNDPFKPGRSSKAYNLLVSIREFVRHFFSCTECSRNFVKAASLLTPNSPPPHSTEMDESSSHENLITSPDTAVIWLWNMHNHVNERLSKDISEDPLFPKIAYPPKILCSDCLVTHLLSEEEKMALGNKSDESYIYWDRARILEYLSYHYGPTNIITLSETSSIDLSPKHSLKQKLMQSSIQQQSQLLKPKPNRSNLTYLNSHNYKNYEAFTSQNLISDAGHVKALSDNPVLEPQFLVDSNLSTVAAKNRGFDRFKHDLHDKKDRFGHEKSIFVANSLNNNKGQPSFQFPGPVTAETLALSYNAYLKGLRQSKFNDGNYTKTTFLTRDPGLLDRDNFYLCIILWLLSIVCCLVFFSYFCRYGKYITLAPNFHPARSLNYYSLTGKPSSPHYKNCNNVDNSNVLSRFIINLTVKHSKNLAKILFNGQLYLKGISKFLNIGNISTPNKQDFKKYDGNIYNQHDADIFEPNSGLIYENDDQPLKFTNSLAINYPTNAHYNNYDKHNFFTTMASKVTD